MFSHHFEYTQDTDNIEKTPTQTNSRNGLGIVGRTTTKSDLPACLHSPPAGYHHPTMAGEDPP
ncbi:unnamed protein product [Ectocarpus sp. 8 AP-2014]